MTAPTYTPNYNLIKPDPQAIVDVQNINDNSDKIDQGLSGTFPVQDPAALITVYPMGTSMFPLLAADITTYPNWAVGYQATSAQVFTFRDRSDRGVQYWFRNVAPAGYVEGWMRNMATSGNTPWRKIGDQDSAALNATADIVINDNTWSKPTVNTAEGKFGYSLDISGSSIIVRDPGLYAVECTAVWQGGSSGTANVGFGQSGDSAPNIFYRTGVNIGTSAAILNGHWTKNFVANESIQLFVLQNSGAGRTLSQRRLVVSRVGATIA